MKTPLVIISFDGLSTKDLEYVSEMPGFKRFLSEASGSKQVQSVYPSITYAAHASIITGCFPIRHGVVDNTKVEPQRYESPDWYWYQKDLKVPTLYDVAHQNDYSVAALLWPTTGRSKIAYNMPEIFSNRKWTSQMMVSVYAGTPMYQLGMVKNHGHLRDGKKQPALDHFTTACTLETIEKYQPDMLLVHLTDLDSIRHLHGHNSPEAIDALHRHDVRLTQILDALAAHEKYNHAYLAILGDHSSKDVTEGISVNQKLKLLGYLKHITENEEPIEEKNLLGFRKIKEPKEIEGVQLTQIKAYAKSCDGSCYIYGFDDALKDEVLEDLQRLFADMPEVQIYDHDTLVSKGADPRAWCMLEATPPYHFVDDLIEPWIQPVAQIPYYKGASVTAVHGFRPELADYNTVFYVRGPYIEPHVDIPKMHLVDIAPTLADLMGWSLLNVDGESFKRTLSPEHKQTKHL